MNAGGHEGPDHEVDVLVLGAGLAGLSLARLLTQRLPGVQVLVAERRAEDAPGLKVGESTVEVGARFLDQRLGLGDWLGKNALPKNGLRFWFAESPETDWQAASEDGPPTFGYWPTYQFERPALESALRRRVDFAGVTLLYEVSGVAREEAPDGHRVALTTPAGEVVVRARWLVDATGPVGAITRAEGWLVDEPRIPHGACWARYRGARDVDALRGPSRPSSPAFAPRALSTNHVMGDGYWIWLIPLRGGLTSIGLVYDPAVLTDPPRGAGAFEAFLRRHRMLRDVLGGAETRDGG